MIFIKLVRPKHKLITIVILVILIFLLLIVNQRNAFSGEVNCNLSQKAFSIKTTTKSQFIIDSKTICLEFNLKNMPKNSILCTYNHSNTSSTNCNSLNIDNSYISDDENIILEKYDSFTFYSKPKVVRKPQVRTPRPPLILKPVRHPLFDLFPPELFPEGPFIIP